MFNKKSGFEKFRKIYRKTPVLESLFNKGAGIQACNFIKKRLQQKCFPVNIAKFLKISILKNMCDRLPLSFVIYNGEQICSHSLKKSIDGKFILVQWN